jgi:hypothetical protein
MGLYKSDKCRFMFQRSDFAFQFLLSMCNIGWYCDAHPESCSLPICWVGLCRARSCGNVKCTITLDFEGTIEDITMATTSKQMSPKQCIQKWAVRSDTWSRNSLRWWSLLGTPGKYDVAAELSRANCWDLLSDYKRSLIGYGGIGSLQNGIRYCTQSRSR